MKPIKTKKKSAGFTLVELLVVLSIISLLASFILVQSHTARLKAMDQSALAQTKDMAQAIDLYFQDKNKVPTTGAAVLNWGALGSVPGAYWTNSSDPNWNSLLDPGLSQYLKKMPSFNGPNTIIYYFVTDSNYVGHAYYPDDDGQKCVVAGPNSVLIFLGLEDTSNVDPNATIKQANSGWDGWYILAGAGAQVRSGDTSFGPSPCNPGVNGSPFGGYTGN